MWHSNGWNMLLANNSLLPLSQSLVPNQNLGLPAQLPKPRSLVNPDNFAKLLGDHPKVQFLVDGFRNGFHIPHISHPASRTSRNHRSVREHQEVLPQYIHAEEAAGRIVGPFATLPREVFVASPLGVIPKNEPGFLSCSQATQVFLQQHSLQLTPEAAP